MSAGRSPTCCACRRIGWLARTIVSPTSGAASRFRHSAIDSTMSGPPCECTNIPMAGLPSSTARVVLHALIPKEAVAMSHLPLKSARRPRALVDLWTGQERGLPTSSTGPKANATRSGQMMCYKRRTSSRATDRRRGGGGVRTWPEPPLRGTAATRLLSKQDPTLGCQGQHRRPGRELFDIVTQDEFSVVSLEQPAEHPRTTFEAKKTG